MHRFCLCLAVLAAAACSVNAGLVTRPTGENSLDFASLVSLTDAPGPITADSAVSSFTPGFPTVSAGYPEQEDIQGLTTTILLGSLVVILAFRDRLQRRWRRY